MYGAVPPDTVISIAPSAAPLQLTLVTKSVVTVNTAGSVMLIGPWFAVHEFASVTTRL